MAKETTQQIFSLLKNTMGKHCPPLVCKTDTATGYEVIGNIAVPYGSKKVMVDGMYFSSIMLKKDYVAFYFHPMYYSANEFTPLIPSTLKFLKGKTCFYFKKPEDVNTKELNAIFKKGIAYYKKMGWVK